MGRPALALSVTAGAPWRLLVVAGGQLSWRSLWAEPGGLWEKIRPWPRVLEAGATDDEAAGAGGESGGVAAADPGGGGQGEVAGEPVPLRMAGTARGVVVGGSAGLEEWTLGAGAAYRRRHRLDGRPVSALAVEAGGRRVVAAQGRWLWRGERGRFARLAASPAGPWRHLAAHPRRRGWLLGLAGGAVLRSSSGGRRWEPIPGAPLGAGAFGGGGALREARFAGCPAGGDRVEGSGAGSGATVLSRTRTGVGAVAGARVREGDGVLLWSGEAVVWLAAGRERSRLVPASPPRALLEADPADPAVYVAADRLYRWPCGRGAGPVALAVRAEGVVALLRDPRRPGRIWVLGERGLQRLEGPLGASARTGARAEGGLPAVGLRRRGRRGAAGTGRRRPGACGRRALAELAATAHAAWRRPWAFGSTEAARPAPRAAWLPRITLSAGAVVRHGAELVLADRPRLARRRRPRFQALLSLRWPLEVPAPAVLEEAGARAAARRAALARQVRRLLPPCGDEDDPIARFAARAERAAVERYFRAAAARRRHGKGPGRGAPPGPRTVEEIP